MSYEIVYNRQFLKTQNGKIIPIILHGSNNTYQVQLNGRERRSRRWSICNMPHWCNYKIDFTEEELLKENEQWLQEKEFFKYNGKYITGQQWYNMVKNSIKKARTIEELQPYERPLAYLSIWKGLENTHTSPVFINNSANLQAFIEMYYARVVERKEGEKVYPVIEYGVEKFVHQRSNRIRQDKPRLTEYYTVKVDNGHNLYYVQQLTSRHLRGTYNEHDAKQFKTEKEAKKWIDERSIEKRFRIKCQIEKISEAA